ncbi:MAG TPA: SH3 domain-containing protein [Leptolyngbya sp.]|nr:SH3 domain-containing protein [Leptolyngbya sp.]
MKYKVLILSGAVVLTAAVSSTIAAVTYFSPKPAPVAKPAIEQSNPTPPTAEKFNPPVATSPNSNRFPIALVDESVQSPEFAKFLDRVKQAVRDRDAKFIRSIVTPKTKFSFGANRSIDYLNPDNPKSPFWESLEKALVLGCSKAPEGYSCPTVFQQFQPALKNSTSPETDAFSAIVVVGQNVNVRSQANNNAPVIATLTNEIVKYDANTFQNASTQDKGDLYRLDNLDGWTPIILPDDQRGFVSSRYAYSPVGYRVFFDKEGGEWKMQAFVTGD